MRAAIHTLLAELHFAGMAQTLDRVLDGCRTGRRSTGGGAARALARGVASPPGA